ncbi:hypothetical protein [Phycisphaera mikurensis]|uniref:Thioredoxin domain-containing protein n=1 Tax=Phycisphaera mikurensis (strain NBRC 102666 / KCTC 22515 / FYK2301M01) TaxID=1142394 RepID=I0II48_PHYMF|nr:hypothetical protein [Phycisphaera mikurensis]MBB6442501.1 hypothetical protein [Phycisphaera mikurensis]BAM04936.1 hypothetical protein PSMK_27770 [Phycisphaera mikurensis NBRC 102666]
MSIAQTGRFIRFARALPALASAALAAAAAAGPDSWPEARSPAPDAGGAAAVVVWLDAAPADADAAADRALLAEEALASRLDAFAAFRLPWPAGGLQNRAAISRHAALADAWGVRRLPAWVLMDPAGRVFARFDEGTPLAASAEDAADRLEEAMAALRTRDARLAEAEGADGLARAALLDAALGAVEPFAVSHHAAIVEEVLALDADDDAGLRTRWWAAWAEPRLQQRLEESVFPLVEERRFGGARAALLAVRDAEPLPAALVRKLDVFAAQLRFSAGDADGARRAIEQVLDATPPGEEADAYAELLAGMAEG